MEKQEINQSELARRANMALSSLNRAFNALDNNVSPRLETLAAIARGLGVQASDLLKADLASVVPIQQDSNFALARQLSRLVEDFLLCSASDRTELLGLANELATRTEYKKGQRQ
jgi:transcriptional regulator with XRE-family HTH domain